MKIVCKNVETANLPLQVSPLKIVSDIMNTLYNAFFNVIDCARRRCGGIK